MDQELRDFMKESRDEFTQNALFRGQVGEFMGNTTAYIGAVSKKADDIRNTQREHEIDVEAHGKSAEEKAGRNIHGWIAIVIAAFAALANFMDKK